jgi:hypothetical protein
MKPSTYAITVAGHYVAGQIAVSGVGTLLWLDGLLRITVQIVIISTD